MKAAIIGAGNEGKAMAAHLYYLGCDVQVFSHNPSKVKSINANGITLVGEIYFHANVKATGNLAEILNWATHIFITTPANIHKQLALECKNFLKNQKIVLMPGRTFGELEFRKASGYTGTIAEMQTPLYTCREKNENTIELYALKRKVRVATFPRDKGLVRDLKQISKSFVEAKSILETSINNMGAIFHPTPTILNIGLVESKIAYKYYAEAITPSIAIILEKLDDERIRIGEGLGIETITARQWLKETYGVKGKTLYESISKNEYYSKIEGPKTIAHRYIYEDIPTGMLPIFELGNLTGNYAKTMGSIIEIGKLVAGDDFENGRTLKNLEIRSVDRLKEYYKVK